jgi:hypothetical protein
MDQFKSAGIHNNVESYVYKYVSPQYGNIVNCLLSICFSKREQND